MAPLLIFITWMAAPLLFVMLFLLPAGLMAHSMANLIEIPRQILNIAVNRRLRQHHAVEHATINILENRYGATNLVGLSREDGFIIRGWSDPMSLKRAAEEGLFRLKQGESGLAVHRRCGTSLAVGNFVTAAMVLVLLLMWGQLEMVSIVLAGGILLLASPLLGVLVQRYLTTSTDVRSLEIVEIVPVGQPRPGGILSMIFSPTRPTVYFVATRDAGEKRNDDLTFSPYGKS